MTASNEKRSVVPTFFAYVAICMGTSAFVQAGMKGHRVGWEEMMLYSGPAVICGLLAIVMRRCVGEGGARDGDDMSLWTYRQRDLRS